MVDFLYMDPDQEDRILQGWRNRQQSQQRARAAVTPELAARMVQLAEMREDASGDVVQGMALTGAPDDAFNAAVDREPAPVDWIERGVAGATGFLDTIFNDYAYNRFVKPAIRGAFVLSDTLAQEIVQRPLVAASAAMTDGIGGQTFSDAYSDYGNSVGVRAFEDLRENFEEGGAGQAWRRLNQDDNPETDADESFLGTGFFAGGEVQQESYNQRTLQIDGQRANFGNAMPVARSMSYFGSKMADSENPIYSRTGRFIAPGGAAYSAVSGVTQFAADVFADPLALLTVGTSTGARAVGKTAQAFGVAEDATSLARVTRAVEGGVAGAVRRRRLFDPQDAGNAVREATEEAAYAANRLVDTAEEGADAQQVLAEHAGLLDGIRQSVLFEKSQAFLHKPEVLDKLAEADRYTIWRSMKKNNPNLDVDLVRRLGDASTPQDVSEVLMTAIGKGQVTDKGFYPKIGKFRRNSSFAGMAPRGTISMDNHMQGVDILDSWGRVAKLDEADRIELVNRAIDARDQTDIFNVAADMVEKADLGDTAELSRLIKRNAEDVTGSTGRAYRIDADGDMVKSPFNRRVEQKINGEDVMLDVPTPHLESEMIQAGFQMPDVVAVRRAARRVDLVKRTYDALGWDWAQHVASDGARWLTRDLFKPLAILRPAYVVRIGLEEQARLAAAGFDSLLNHPVRWMMANVAARNRPDGEDTSKVMDFLRGRVFEDADSVDGATRTLTGELGENSAEAMRIITSDATAYSDDIGRARHTGAPEFDVLPKSPDNVDLYSTAWGNELTQLAGDRAARRLAATGGDLDDLVDWARNTEQGRRWADSVARINDEFATIPTNDSRLRELGQIIDDQIRVKTGGVVEDGRLIRDGDETLLRAIAEGRGWSKGKAKVSGDEVRLSDLNDLGPSKVKADKALLDGEGPGRLQKMTDYLFDIFAGKPTSYLARWPAYRQFMVRNIEEAMPALKNSALRTEVYEQAVKNLQLTKAEARSMREAMTIANSKAGGGLIDDVTLLDEMVKTRAGQQVKDLLFDTTSRSNAQVALEPIFPFLDAWEEVTTTWLRLTTETMGNPVIRAMQGMQSLQESGAIYANDFGDQVFAYPATQGMLRFFGAVAPGAMPDTGGEADLALEGRVQGANIVAQGVGPGFGPLVQWGVGSFDFFDREGVRQVRDWLAPFGTEIDDAGELTLPSNVVDAVLPAWWDKISNAMTAGQVDEHQWNTAVGDTAKVLIASGRYDPNSRDGRDKLLADAQKGARFTLIMRGVVQGVGITGPSATWRVGVGEGANLPDDPWDPQADPEARAYTLGQYARWYRDLLEQANFDSQAADAQFIQMYGIEPFYITQAKTQGVEELPVTTEGNYWIQDHKAESRKYPSVIGFFVPADAQEGDLDYSVFRSQIEQGARQSLTGEQQVALANKTEAYAIYNAARKMLEDAPYQARRTGLQRIRAGLDEQFPGWQADVLGVEGKASTEDRIKELRDALDDPGLQDAPAIDSMRAYLSARDRLEALAQSERDASLAADRNADLREVLLAIGNELKTNDPDFSPVWERLLKREVEA